MLVNNSNKPLKWAIDLSKGNEVLEEGVFKFLHSSGMPYLSHDGSGVQGSLEPGQTQSLGVLFCPGKTFCLYTFEYVISCFHMRRALKE